MVRCLMKLADYWKIYTHLMTGPFSQAKQFDDDARKPLFDNVQFVDFHHEYVPLIVSGNLSHAELGL